MNEADLVFLLIFGGSRVYHIAGARENLSITPVNVSEIINFDVMHQFWSGQSVLNKTLFIQVRVKMCTTLVVKRCSMSIF